MTDYAYNYRLCFCSDAGSPAAHLKEMLGLADEPIIGMAPVVVLTLTLTEELSVEQKQTLDEYMQFRNWRFFVP
jgi:hypothetical protein